MSTGEWPEVVVFPEATYRRVGEEYRLENPDSAPVIWRRVWRPPRVSLDALIAQGKCHTFPSQMVVPEGL